jgi:hypothetical protein
VSECVGGAPVVTDFCALSVASHASARVRQSSAREIGCMSE